MKRAPVQGDRRTRRRHGTIAWDEHLLVHKAYVERWGNVQTAERLAERGGFAYDEIVDLIGREPETWEPR